NECERDASEYWRARMRQRSWSKRSTRNSGASSIAGSFPRLRDHGIDLPRAKRREHAIAKRLLRQGEISVRLHPAERIDRLDVRSAAELVREARAHFDVRHLVEWKPRRDGDEIDGHARDDHRLERLGARGARAMLLVGGERP